MGLGNSGGNKQFITIVNGKWTLRVPEGTEGAVERINKKEVTVYERYFSYVEGQMVGGRIKQGEYGQTVEIDLLDGDVYNVQIPVPDAGKIGDYFMAIGKCAPNIDPAKKLFLGLGHDRDRDKAFLYVKQGGESIHAAFTKDNPNGMPPWEKKEVMGKVTWNADAQNEFLYERITELFSKLDGGGAQQEAESAGFKEAPPESDVPF